MDRLARLIGLLLLFVSFGASAQSQYYAQHSDGSGLTNDDGTALCTALYPSYTITGFQPNGSNFACVYRSSSGNYYLIGSIYGRNCSAGQVYYGGSCQSVPTCVAGQIYQASTNSCVDNCPSNGTQLPGAGMGTVFEAGDGLTNTVCLAGCEASAFMAAKHEGKNYVWGPIRATGRSCVTASPTPPGTAAPNVACPVGKCPGTLNGNQICVPCSETKQDTKASSSETAASAASGATPGPGQTTTRSGSSSTTCAGDTCTTTGQQTVTNPDGSTETKSTTTTQSKGDYCTENPKAGACTGSESTWGGTCQAFTCDGDAVQCAQARGAWELACQLKTEATESTVQAGTEAMAGTGEAAIKDQLGMNTSQAFDLASRLDSTSLFGTPGACPSDTTLSLGIGSVTLPFASMCPQLNLVGVAMMGLAYLIAAFIVFRPGKGA